METNKTIPTFGIDIPNKRVPTLEHQEELERKSRVLRTRKVDILVNRAEIVYRNDEKHIYEVRTNGPGSPAGILTRYKEGAGIVIDFSNVEAVSFREVKKVPWEDDIETYIDLGETKTKSQEHTPLFIRRFEIEAPDSTTDKKEQVTVAFTIPELLAIGWLSYRQKIEHDSKDVLSQTNSINLWINDRKLSITTKGGNGGPWNLNNVVISRRKRRNLTKEERQRQLEEEICQQREERQRQLEEEIRQQKDERQRQLEEEICQLKEEIRQLKEERQCWYEEYAKMDIASLKEVVKNYLAAKGIAQRPIDIEIVESKFGKPAVDLLIRKSYLMRFRVRGKILVTMETS